MPSLARSSVERALKKKGFQAEPRQDPHRWYRLYLDGEKTIIVTKVSTGKGYKILGDSLVSKMARQLHIQKAEFIDYVDCTLTLGGYRALLKERRVAV